MTKSNTSKQENTLKRRMKSVKKLEQNRYKTGFCIAYVDVYRARGDRESQELV